ncbi:MAG: aminotransferase class V-fold PLP-dependent enzyme [Acidimicrobiales bacterium]
MPTPIDHARIEAIRAASPGFLDHVHLNNAGSSIPSDATVDAMVDYLRFEARVGGYEAKTARLDAVDAFRPALAELLGVDRGEIAFMPNDTAGFAAAVWGLAATGAIGAGSRVLVDRATYVSHYLALLQLAGRHDLELVAIPSDEAGVIDLDALDGLLDDRVAAVSLTHVGTHRGSINPVTDAGERIRQGSGALFLLDACQSVGQLPVDLRAIDCDVATATGRKFLRGPRGSGLLYVRADVQDRIDPPGIDGAHTSWVDVASYEPGDDARRFEPFEASFAVQVGFGVAVRELLELGIEPIGQRIVALGEQLRDTLGEVAGVAVHDGGHERGGIVTFTQDGRSPAEVQAALTAAGVAVSVTQGGSARLDLGVGDSPAEAVRASVHYPNNDDDLDRLVDVVAAR